MTRGELFQKSLESVESRFSGDAGCLACMEVNLIVPNVPDGTEVQLPRGFRNWNEVVEIIVSVAGTIANLSIANETSIHSELLILGLQTTVSVKELDAAGIIKNGEADFYTLLNHLRAIAERRENNKLGRSKTLYHSPEWILANHWIRFGDSISLAACDNNSAALVFQRISGAVEPMTENNFSRKKAALGLVSLKPARIRVEEKSGHLVASPR